MMAAYSPTTPTNFNETTSDEQTPREAMKASPQEKRCGCKLSKNSLTRSTAKEHGSPISSPRNKPSRRTSFSRSNAMQMARSSASRLESSQVATISSLAKTNLRFMRRLWIFPSCRCSCTLCSAKTCVWRRSTSRQHS
jgi:hypothetical protein